MEYCGIHWGGTLGAEKKIQRYLLLSLFYNLSVPASFFAFDYGKWCMHGWIMEGCW